jgi:hypothetical protein
MTKIDALNVFKGQKQRVCKDLVSILYRTVSYENTFCNDRYRRYLGGTSQAGNSSLGCFHSKETLSGIGVKLPYLLVETPL